LGKGERQIREERSGAVIYSDRRIQEEGRFFTESPFSPGGVRSSAKLEGEGGRKLRKRKKGTSSKSMARLPGLGAPKGGKFACVKSYKLTSVNGAVESARRGKVKREGMRERPSEYWENLTNEYEKFENEGGWGKGL